MIRNQRHAIIEKNGGIPVNVQDQTTEIIDLHLSQFKSNLTLTVDPSPDDTSITGTVDVAFVPIIGDVVCLKEGTAFYQAEVLSVTSNGGDNYTLGLDTPIDYDFSLSGGCSISTQEINVDGSITPQIFRISPVNLQDSVEWDVVRIIFVMNDDAAMDDGRFGGIVNGLTKGLVLRTVNGIRKNIFNIKTNGDFAAHAYDVEYVPATLGPNGQYGFRCRRTFGGQSKNGVVIRLTAKDADELQVIIQDDLTSLTKFHVIVQGHVTTG